MLKKIKTQEEIKNIISDLKSQGKKIVTTNGSFDIMHAGHLGFLEEAKTLGDVFIVLLNTDSSISRNKGPNHPIIPQDIGAEMLSDLEAIDYVVLFDEEKPLKLLQELQPHIHTRGGRADPYKLKEEIEFIAQWGGEHKSLGLREGFSTTQLIETIKEKYNLTEK